MYIIPYYESVTCVMFQGRTVIWCDRTVYMYIAISMPYGITLALIRPTMYIVWYW